MENREQANSKPVDFVNRVTTYIGIISSIFTLILGYLNYRNEQLIRDQKDRLDSLEFRLKERTTTLDESRERVARYNWVFGLFPALYDVNENKQTFTINLVKLALDDSEERQLFNGLKVSPDEKSQSLGQLGLISIIDPLVSTTMNDPKAELRKEAFGKLTAYKSSPEAIELVLQQFKPDQLSKLSPSGIINGLYFLKQTNRGVWRPQQVTEAQQLLVRLKANNPGPQTTELINDLSRFLTTANVSLF
ncbi:hypothetical protein [Spirosoma sp.]|uniref:hypothetical protein n=1 Tax=Spirosoma sp. TaxID=1899569 RepID=UPI0026204FD9|nr:hypothetical protein [Spirosoma sp.]MCX6215362.1 hypothetical protein [Spirosoma sp.]